MPPKNAQSHRLGTGTLADGASITVYRAALALVCARCGRSIEPGALFTRQSQRAPLTATGVHLTIRPICRTCRPFAFGPTEDD